MTTESKPKPMATSVFVTALLACGAGFVVAISLIASHETYVPTPAPADEVEQCTEQLQRWLKMHAPHGKVTCGPPGKHPTRLKCTVSNAEWTAPVHLYCDQEDCDWSK